MTLWYCKWPFRPVSDPLWYQPASSKWPFLNLTYKWPFKGINYQKVTRKKLADNFSKSILQTKNLGWRQSFCPLEPLFFGIQQTSVPFQTMRTPFWCRDFTHMFNLSTSVGPRSCQRGMFWNLTWLKSSLVKIHGTFVYLSNIQEVPSILCKMIIFGQIFRPKTRILN